LSGSGHGNLLEPPGRRLEPTINAPGGHFNRIRKKWQLLYASGRIKWPELQL
jgi:hypothetical protein